MKIKKYQSGGIYYTPFFRDSVTQAESLNTTSSTKDDKEDDLIEKEIVNVLKENGLPNDVDYFLSKANTFLKKSKSLGSLFGTGQSSSYDMSDLIRLHSLANRVKHNSKLYEQASSQITKEGSGSEVAITDTGNLYVIDEEEGLKTIGLNTYHKNPDKYKILTNYELMQLREEHSNLAYNGTILKDLKNTVGMKSIVDYIRSTISSFGTNKSSNQFDRYTTKQKGQIERGFEQLLGFDSPDGTYKITTSSSASDQGYNDAESLNIAVNYLYRTLPENMKKVLKANAVAEGFDPNDINGVKNFLTTAIVINTNHSRDAKQELNTPKKSSDGSSSGSSGSTGMTPITFGASVQRNMGEVRSNGWVLPGGNVKFNLPTYWYDARTIDNKTTKELTTAIDAYQNLRDHGIVDTRGTVTFGGIPLDQIASQGGDILVDNSKGMGVSYLPVDDKGNVDMQIFSIMTQIQEQIINNRITDKAKVREIWENNGFDYDEEKNIGVPHNQSLKRFVLLSAYTSKNGQIEKKLLKSDPMISEIDKELYNNFINSYNLDSDNKQKMEDIGLFGGSAFQGLLIIPLNNNENASNIAGGIAYTTKPNADVVKARQDFVRQNGGYDPNTGIYDRSLNGISPNGITSNSLD